VKLGDYGYKITSIAPSRHTALGKAVKGNGYRKVLKALGSRKGRYSGYKFKRVRADIHWLNDKK